MKLATPNIIFIQETKCSIQKLKQIYGKWLNRFVFLEVKAENTAGGILTLWNPQKVSIIDAEASRNYLSVIIQPVGVSDTFLITNVYVPQRIYEKLKFLESLVDLRSRHEEIPWVMGGDFNMIKSLLEKKGGTRMLSKDSVVFQSFTEDMKLVDSEMHNDLLTWNNKRGGDAQVTSKLDIFLISEELMLVNKEITTSVLPFGGFDHWPIQLEIKGIDSPRNRPFRFDNIWPSHPDFNSNIEKWWSKDLQIQGTKMFLLHKRLKHIRLKLKEWNKKYFGNIFVDKESAEIKLQELNQALIIDGFDKVKSEQVDKHNQEWEILCKQEEIFWRQKSRVQWLKKTSHKNIEAVLVQHFKGIKKENNLDIDQCIKEITKNIPKMVSREDNFNLNKLVTKEEVSEVIRDMHNGKALGPNGFNVDFFKACWNVVKQDILNVVEDSRRSRTILKALNTSFISLIPKQDLVLTSNTFRPIALCNVVYKIISKILASKLKPLLPSLISGEQSSYVEGRQILNNIIQAHEVVHMLTSKMQAGMIMQLDIAKAYDEVNWIYMKKVLIAFGFDHNWARWVMALVTSSSFSILVNGSPSEIFTPSRGLRQGDPLSPFLFILMMEGLGRSINQAKVLGKIKSLQLM
eukprot:PITA_24397